MAEFNLDYELRLLHAQLTAFAHANRQLLDSNELDDEGKRAMQTHNNFVMALANRIEMLVKQIPFEDPALANQNPIPD